MSGLESIVVPFENRVVKLMFPEGVVEEGLTKGEMLI